MEDESPVTRSIRYTSTLILRNLIRSATRGDEWVVNIFLLLPVSVTNSFKIFIVLLIFIDLFELLESRVMFSFFFFLFFLSSINLNLKEIEGRNIIG